MLESKIFIVFNSIPILFQIALTLGAPYGELTMGGIHKNKLPKKQRFFTAVQALLLFSFSVLVGIQGDLFLKEFKQDLMFFNNWVLGILVISLVLNTITPSKKERIWAPILLVMLYTAYQVLWVN